MVFALVLVALAAVPGAYSAAASASSTASSAASTSTAAALNTWYAPKATKLNNLTAALNTPSGVYGFVFSSSTTPGNYSTYNWCNMPHVRKQEYVVPADKKLVYAEVIHRHHKRTPYAANALPVEPYEWDCSDARLHVYNEPLDSQAQQLGAAPSLGGYIHPVFSTPANPFLAAMPGWKGSCQFPQLTAGGDDDAFQHGADLYGVYHSLLGLLPDVADTAAWASQVRFRVTNNEITAQTAGMILGGMGDAALATPLDQEPSSYDALEPQYTCAAGTTLFNAIKSTSAGTVWGDHLTAAAGVYAALDAASGVSPTDAGFHASFDHYYDNLSARQCHGKPAVAGIDQALTDTVYRLGQWEYSRMYRDDSRSLAASVGNWGVWVAQLAHHLRAVEAGTSATKYFHNVAHDGSVSRFLSILQADEMVWPGMGSEIVVEVWEGGCTRKSGKTKRAATSSSSSKLYARVLFGGQVLTSSHPSLGALDMIPLDTLLAYFDALTGVDASLLVGKCNGTVALP